MMLILLKHLAKQMLNTCLAKKDNGHYLNSNKQCWTNHEAIKFFNLTKSFFDSEVKTLLNALAKNFIILGTAGVGWFPFFIIIRFEVKLKIYTILNKSGSSLFFN